MKRRFFLLSIATIVLLSGCWPFSPNKRYTNLVPDDSYVVPNYKQRALIVHYDKDMAKGTVTCNFFEGFENVPYIAVDTYFKEFFNTELDITKKNHTYTYKLNKNSTNYISFDTDQWLILTNNLAAFTNHPDFKVTTGKTFVHLEKQEKTSNHETILDLRDYRIPIYDWSGHAYVPLTLLSQFAGGYQLYNVAYNGKDIFLIDYNGELNNNPVYPSTFGNRYFEVLSNMSEARPVDLANYTYNELCLVFDHFRGYTSQLLMGDERLLTLGLDGLLSHYYPELKEYLLSTDKTQYYIGFNALFAGLYDGGHTNSLNNFNEFNEAVESDKTQPFNSLVEESQERRKAKGIVSTSAASSKALESKETGFLPNYTTNNYAYDETYKTAYINVKNFDIDVKGWDFYYKGQGEIPLATDAYANVRSKFYKALEDGAKNVVLDLTTNGGGSSLAFAGLIGLCNGAKSTFSVNDTFNKTRETEYYGIDINLDGLFDEKDITEASKFNFNIGVLTSAYSFSCANLFPSEMKELGFKILGEKSGGGSCAIYLTTTADGLLYVHSAYHCLTDKAGNNIDSGVPVDLEIEIGEGAVPGTLDYKNFFDPSITGTYLSSAYNS